MNSIATELHELIERARGELLAIPESTAEMKPYPDKWSLKEVLGHLVDSAANNHQRIVRMQETRDIGTFSYTQQHWVSTQHYQNEPWHNLVDFWDRYNDHMAHIIGHVDPGALDHHCDIGYAKPASLRFVIEDYVRHIRHHLEQIMSVADPKSRTQWVRREPG